MRSRARAQRLVAGLALFAMQSVARSGASQIVEPPGLPERRLEYDRLLRARPGEDIPLEALERARQQLVSSGMLRRSQAAANAVSAATTGWVSLGPRGFYESGIFDAGRVDGIAIDPKDPDHLVIASPAGGIWMSNNAGATWAPIGDDACALNVSAVAFDPVDSRIMYAGRTSTASLDCQFLRSTDGGATWAPLGRPAQFSNGTYSIYIDPETAGNPATTTILMGGATGLFRSTNGGADWTLPLPTAFRYFSLTRHPTQAGVLYAGAVDYSVTPRQGTLFRSMDFGATWTKVEIPARALENASRIQIAVSP